MLGSRLPITLSVIYWSVGGGLMVEQNANVESDVGDVPGLIAVVECLIIALISLTLGNGFYGLIRLVLLPVS